MMYPLLLLRKEIDEDHKALIAERHLLYGKCTLRPQGPGFPVLTTAAYERFVDSNGLRGRIALEFTRKSLMRCAGKRYGIQPCVTEHVSRATMPPELGHCSSQEQRKLWNLGSCCQVIGERRRVRQIHLLQACTHPT